MKSKELKFGKKIRFIRNQQNRTLEEVASSCGFSKSLLSKIENGVTIPPIATLMKIAETLGVSVSDILEDNKENGTVYTPASAYADPEKLVKTEKGYSFYAFAAARQDKIMQPYYFTARKNEVDQQVLAHKGEEFIYVLEGKMKYQVGNTEYTLESGDSVYFSSLEEHVLAPLTEEVQYLAIFALEPSE